jgi:REP element-mobilizing transposase RayT
VTWRLRQGQSELSPDERQAVVQVLRNFDGLRYELMAFVVMNDHVHTIVRPFEGQRLDKILQGWKGVSSRLIAPIQGRTAGLWQNESFDRLIRHDLELAEKRDYILGNPFKRWPDLVSYPWMSPI